MQRFLFIIFLFAFALLTATHAKASDPENLEVISKIDLTHALSTPPNWNLIVTHDSDDSGIYGVVGNLHFCFIQNGKSTCPDICWLPNTVLGDGPTCPNQSGTEYNAFEGLDSFRSIGRTKADLIVAKVGWTGGGSAFWSGPIIWAYNRHFNRFKKIFSAVENGSNNGEVRFISDGPLAGDVILNRLTSPWPYRYKIIVYRLVSSERYIKVLDYNGNTTEGDGNALAVIDAEMPEIEHRLGYWEKGDALPNIPPANIPSQCKTPIRIQKGLAWCDWSR